MQDLIEEIGTVIDEGRKDMLLDQLKAAQDNWYNAAAKFANKQGKKDGYSISVSGYRWKIRKDGTKEEIELMIMFPGGVWGDVMWTNTKGQGGGEWTVIALAPEGFYYQKLKPAIDDLFTVGMTRR